MMCGVLIVVLAGLGFTNAIPMTLNDFKPFEFKCFNRTGSVPNVNGQVYPLASTLDNFLDLVDKLEAANPEMKLEQEVFFLLNNFTIYNLVYSEDDDFNVMPPPNLNTDLIQRLWQFSNQGFPTDNIKIPYTDDEYCSLFNMLSNNIANYETPQEANIKRYEEVSNTGEPMMADENTGPAREFGVVSVMGTKQAVAIGRVLAGVYLSLQQVQKKKLSEVVGQERFTKYEQDLQNRDPFVEPLYLLTVVEPIISSALAPTANKRLYPDGEWKYLRNVSPLYYPVPQICPTVYEVPRDYGYLYSYSSMRGGFDGALLGSVIAENRESFKDRTLSEILRQYYNYQGVQSPSEPTKRASLCRRQKFAVDNQDFFFNMTEAYLAVGLPMTSSKWPRTISIAKDELDKNREKILELDQVLGRYCNSEKPSESRKESCENPDDIILVVDSVDKSYFKKQQNIIGYLANKIDMWQNGSSVTVIANQESGETNDLFFMPDTSSKACLACQITQREAGTGTRVSFDKVIDFVSEVLEKKKREQHQMNGAPGKVVVIFKYSPEQNTREIENAMIKLRVNNMDAQILGVGKDKNLVTMITGNVEFNTIMTGEGDDEKTAEEIALKICNTPGALQYEFCETGAQEAESVFKGLVSTNSKQYWRMDPKYFEKSLSNMNFKVQATGGGDIQVCHNKASTPDSEPKNCEVLPVGGAKTYRHPNPCNGLSREACSPLVFSIHGLENKTDTERKEFCKPREATDKDGALYCKKLDQISFEISHEGVRCSGCSSMYTAPFLLAFAFIFYSVINKFH